MLAAALRRSVRHLSHDVCLACLSSSPPDAAGSAAEQQEAPARRGSERTATRVGPLVVPRDTECLIRQRVGLKNVNARIRSGRLTWVPANARGQEVADDTPPEKPAWSLGYAWRRLCGEARHLRAHGVDQFKALFLPVGFPDTVKENYVRYSVMSAATNLLICTNVTLSSAMLLYAVGLGSAAVPMAGALNWVIKDGVGQAGTLLLGRMVAHDFDLNTRTWYFVANAVVALACLAEILTVYAPAHFLLMASAANTLKGVSMMAGGSTRAAFNISFAQGENIADITAKATSQYICTSLVGTCAGIVISSQISNDVAAAVGVSVAMSLVAAALTYATIRSVPLANLNSTRLQLLLATYARATRGAGAPAVVALPRPAALCATDPVLALPALAPRASPFHPALEVNTPLSELCHPALGVAAIKLAALVRLHRGERHLLMRDGMQRASRIHILLHERATPEDAIAAMLHAVLFRREVRQHARDVLDLDEEARLLHRTLCVAARHRAAVLQSLRDADWNMTRVAIEGFPCRGSW